MTVRTDRVHTGCNSDHTFYNGYNVSAPPKYSCDRFTYLHVRTFACSADGTDLVRHSTSIIFLLTESYLSDASELAENSAQFLVFYSSGTSSSPLYAVATSAQKGHV